MDHTLPQPFGMRRMKSLIKQWMIPPGVQDLIQSTRTRMQEERTIRATPCLNDNLKFKGIHRGQRCFILCSGPSILQEDLRPLQNETCISVTTFYHYHQFKDIRPRYHCIPRMDAGYIEDKAVEFFQEMHRGILDAIMFMAASEIDLVRRYRLFEGRPTYFVLMMGSTFPADIEHLDLTRVIPCAQTVPIMCLLLALYMGFKEIYLLGVDHDWFRNWVKDYCFDRRKIINFDRKPFVGADNAVLMDRLTVLEGTANLFRQYHAIDAIARSAGTRVVNLSVGSFLNVFPMARLKDVL